MPRPSETARNGFLGLVPPDPDVTTRFRRPRQSVRPLGACHRSFRTAKTLPLRTGNWVGTGETGGMWRVSPSGWLAPTTSAAQPCLLTLAF